MQFDQFLSVLEQKGLEKHEIYCIEPAEYHFTFTYGAPLLGWRTSSIDNIINWKGLIVSTHSNTFYLLYPTMCFN